MAFKTTFLVREAAPSQAGAVKRAEAWAARYAGASAFSVSDDDTGEVFAAELLSQSGQIPVDPIIWEI